MFPATTLSAGGCGEDSPPVPSNHSHKYTFQVVQVSWGSINDDTDSSSLSSSPRRMSSSICSYPLTQATQDEEACTFDADPVWSCACTLSSLGAHSGHAFSYAPVEFRPQHAVKVPALRLLLETAVVPASIEQHMQHAQNASGSGYAQQLSHHEVLMHCDRGDNSLSPRLSAQLLKRMAQSPRSDIAALCAAAADGDVERVKKLIVRGVPHTPLSHTISPRGNGVSSSDNDVAATPLMLAASGATAGHVECVRCLIGAGAFADLSLPGGRTALFDAAESGCLLTVQLLLSEGADASRNCVWGFTPLLGACRAFGALPEGSSECGGEHSRLSCSTLVDYSGIVQELLIAGADVIATCHDGRTALEYAAQNRDTRIAASLLAVLKRTDACGYVERALTVAIQCHNYEAVTTIASFPGVSLDGQLHSKPALVTAASTGDVQLLRLLLVAGARVDCVGHRQQTALHVCAACDEEGYAVGLLLCARATLNARDAEGNTPLMCAAAAGNAATAVELLQMGAYVDVRNHQGLSALHLACMGSQTNVASALLAAGASVDLYSSDGIRRTPLFAAAVGGSVSTVSMLLAAGAIVDSRDAQSATPLLHACQSANNESDGSVVELLLGARADASNCDKKGGTPLFAACRSGFARGVRALLVHGGVLALHYRISDGTTPLIAAAEHGKAWIVTMLLRAGAPAEYQRRSDGMSAMMVAAAGGHDGCVQALVASGVHVTDRTCMCMTSLHFAAQAGNCNVVKRLVKAGATVDARNARGATALMLAAEAGLCGVVGELLHSGADPNLTDFSGSSSVGIAGRKGNRSVLRKLFSAVAAASAAATCMQESSTTSLGKDSLLDSDDDTTERVQSTTYRQEHGQSTMWGRPWGGIREGAYHADITECLSLELEGVFSEDMT